MRARREWLNPGKNRDVKRTLNALGRSQIAWIHRDAPLPPNVLLHLDHRRLDSIVSLPSGQQRVTQLFRTVQADLIGRNTIATLGQQKDYMKRVRANGGARSSLKREGIVILNGDYLLQRKTAERLGLPIPGRGYLVSSAIRPANTNDSNAEIATIDGEPWVATPGVIYSHDAPLIKDDAKLTDD